MSLDAVFKPKSVAILGASSRKEKAGYKFAKALIDAGYRGKIHFTNPSGGEVFGRRIFPSLREIGEPIDLALVQVSRERIREVLEDCAAAGVKALILYTAGFGEVDELGSRLEAELVAFTKERGIRVVGPNCQGVFSASVGLDLTGSGSIPPGNIGMISQSGGLGSHAWYEAANSLSVGFSSFVSIGNQADIEVHEYLEYMGNDPDTHAVVLYLEGLKVGSGREFLRTARSVAERKPVIAIKGGQTQSGQRAANSHTGSMVGAAAVFSAALREAGVIEVHSFDDLLPVAQTLLLCEPLRSEKIALVGFGGGHSTLAADAVEKARFEIPALSPRTDQRMRELLPYWAPRKNPVDLAGGYLGDLRVWVEVTRAALEEDGIGAVLLYGPWASFMPDLRTGETDWKAVTNEIAALQREYGKPIVAYSHTGRGGIYQNDVLRAAGVPMMDRIQTAVSALDALRRRTQWLDKVRTTAKPVAARDARRLNGTDLGDAPNLTEDEAYRLLSSFGIEVAPYHVAGSAGEARSASTRLGYPTVMKILSRDIIHKSDVHGVVTGIGSEDEAGKAYDDLLERVRQHVNSPVGGTVIVSKQLAGLELIIGYMRDPHFGPVVMAGIGGIFVEVLKDVSIRLAPVTLEDATEMLAELKAAPLLFGARNQSALNVDAVARILVNLGEVGISLPAISEIDLNPVFASRESATVADARIIIDRNGQVEN